MSEIDSPSDNFSATEAKMVAWLKQHHADMVSATNHVVVPITNTDAVHNFLQHQSALNARGAVTQEVKAIKHWHQAGNCKLSTKLQQVFTSFSSRKRNAEETGAAAAAADVDPKDPKSRISIEQLSSACAQAVMDALQQTSKSASSSSLTLQSLGSTFDRVLAEKFPQLDVPAARQTKPRTATATSAAAVAASQAVAAAAAAAAAIGAPVDAQDDPAFDWFTWDDGERHRVPQDYQLQETDTFNSWLMFNFGDTATRVGPLRLVTAKDLLAKKFKVHFSKIKSVMKLLPSPPAFARFDFDWRQQFESAYDRILQMCYDEQSSQRPSRASVMSIATIHQRLCQFNNMKAEPAPEAAASS